MLINLKNEIWKDFKKTSWRDNEIYKVSNYGRVLKYKFDPEGEMIKPYVLGGYEVFSVTKKTGKTDLIYIHRAVAHLFLENPLDKPYVIHTDFDKINNHFSNLDYATKEELVAHNKTNPEVIKARKKARLNPNYSKLSAGKVRMIKRKIFDPNRKTRMRLIAKQFGISEMQLYRIKSGENWGHIEYE
ncbi:NUMOD4 motif-containing protein [Ulvibacter sp. MAR_2010_11]|uniref:endodeoxyribonuclease n=1 Tax=Ulvibacter sp. MAR_2010_11 TaxID=1250229 RepID=UPI000C2B699E|nr:endodeoxyribonuclease [Ulvibacter sp. MAR_2010_11]PKA82814.1 NUMOD4 motif-containing protein [Ulvibacter sp. MAR_2010_11]